MANLINLINFFLKLLSLILIFVVCFADTRRHAPLLVEEDGATRRSNRPAECQFGTSLRELGSTWFADLGPPFGVMYCIRCECVPIQKKRRIVARVQCRNIKNECPKPTCEEPVLLPGRCCKTCPGDIYSPDIVQDLPAQVTTEEEERNMKHFAALLTGRTSYILKREDMKSMYSTNNPQNIMATGRFLFHKKNLYYSFYISEKSQRPSSIQFMDHMGHILEEHSLVIPSNGPTSVYQNTTGKICGVWRRVPRDYRRLLRDDQMNVVLLWGGKFQAELALAGKIGKYPALSTELFSSLLEPAPGTSPEQMAGAGGTAIVSTSSGSTSSIHLTLVLNGIFSPDEIADVPLNIRLESVEKRQIILEDVQRVKKPAHDVNVIEVSSPVSAHELRLLTRGRLTITVESRKKPEALRIQGTVVTRVSCEIFQTVLASHSLESPTRSSGLSWMYLNKEGALVFTVQTNELSAHDTPLITLVDDSGKRKTELEDLTPYFSTNYASGMLERLGPRVLEPLYSGDLVINVATENEPNLIRGKLISRPVADARDSASPTLLMRQNITAPAHLVGMAWISVDTDCNLRYEVTMTGLNNHQQTLQLFLEEIPIEAPGAPVTRKLLEEFNGNYLEGFQLGLPAADLMKLETSVCFLEIQSKDKGESLLKAKLKSVKVPNNCFPRYYTDNDVPSSPLDVKHNDNNLPTAELKCYHSGRFYDEGEQWSSGLESCTMCSCVSGRVKCEPIKCPPIKCRQEDIQMRKGDCCQTCLSSKYLEGNTSTVTQARGCRLGEQFYPIGASWHPYLPPNGYDTCAICTCDPVTQEVQCPRTPCPPLNCSEKVAYRPDKKACCKKCPEAKPSPNQPERVPGDPELQEDQGLKNSPAMSTQEVLSNGGCKTVNALHENGREWHPIIGSHGEQKCIKCRCKDGIITCERKRCTRSVCNNRVANKKRVNSSGGGTTNLIETDDCCSNQCRRSRRHHQNHKKQQQQQQKDSSLNTANTQSTPRS